MSNPQILIDALEKIINFELTGDARQDYTELKKIANNALASYKDCEPEGEQVSDYCDECNKLVVGIPVGEREEYLQTECPECGGITIKIDVSELTNRFFVPSQTNPSVSVASHSSAVGNSIVQEKEERLKECLILCISKNIE